ncbi:hypothetical protein M9Y10_014479 [Tritrichomonas musculus]|uniref:RING-type domain-containing protein n=1 Tax=Tritrichomonas musculus TaxID=1915356 RepID=A0ABR2L0K9_9EUKA
MITDTDHNSSNQGNDFPNDEDTNISYDEEYTNVSYDDEDTNVSYNEEYTNVSYDDEDTDVSYDDEDTDVSYNDEEERNENSDQYCTDVLTLETIQKNIEDQIQNISKLLCISADKSFSLHRKFNWNQNKILEAFCKNTRQFIENYLSELNINKVGRGKCPICYEVNVELHQSPCACIACYDCWKKEIEIQLDNIETSIKPVVCRFDNCGHEIMISDIEKFCGKQKTEKYKKSIIERYISDDPNLIKCSTPNCPNILRIDPSNPDKLIHCHLCGNIFNMKRTVVFLIW